MQAMKSRMGGTTPAAASEKLVHFLKSNPQASDTAEGIARWWVHMPVAVVVQALDSLVKRGIVEKLERDDGVIYRGNLSPESSPDQ